MIALSRSQSREVDRLAVERFAMPSIILMENAARAVADAAMDMLGATAAKDVLILCGGGNNGGDGLAVARHLHNRGCNLRIILTTDSQKYKGDALANWKIIEAMKTPVASWNPTTPTPRPALVIDAIFGTGLDKPPRAPFSDIVKWVEQVGSPVLAVDVPSGLDCDTGEPLGSCITALRTVTFVTQKIGYQKPSAKKYLGEVIVGDIGAPAEIVQMVLSSQRP